MTEPANRVEAFSDGVFAIAITLLILDLRLPDAGSAALGTRLAVLWPSYLAFYAIATGSGSGAVTTPGTLARRPGE